MRIHLGHRNATAASLNVSEILYTPFHLRNCYRKISIFHLIGNAAPGAMWGILEIFL
jgi:hypothetical protein